jgi:adenylate cyclase class 2
MSSYIEIEAKLKVDSLDPVRQKLNDLGASVADVVVQTDIYFDDEQDNLTKADKCIRFRSEENPSSSRLWITYKGPKQIDDYKKRNEIEFEVLDFDPIEKLLNALGYRRKLAFNKVRQVWEFEECEVSLDQLPLLGCFVEIEGDYADDIRLVQNKLELANCPNIFESYASLIDKKLREDGYEEREIFLEKQDLE